MEEYLREFFDSPIWLSHYKAVTYPLLSEVSNATNITLGILILKGLKTFLGIHLKAFCVCHLIAFQYCVIMAFGNSLIHV